MSREPVWRWVKVARTRLRFRICANIIAGMREKEFFLKVFLIVVHERVLRTRVDSCPMLYAETLNSF
jgi:hypothetical protein